MQKRPHVQDTYSDRSRMMLHFMLLNKALYRRRPRLTRVVATTGL